MQRQADHLVGHLRGDGQIRSRGRRQTPVGRKGADERIEIAPSEHARLLHPKIELVARRAVPLRIDEDREIGVVVAHAGHVVEKRDAGHAAQRAAIADGDFAAGFDGFVDVAEVEQSVGGPHFVHLRIDPGRHDLGLAGESEVLEVVDPLFGPGVVADERPAFDRIVGLGRMETQRTDVAGLQHGLAADPYAERMSRIVDHLQSVFVGNLPDTLRVARVAVDMHRQDGRRLRRDGRLDPVGIEVARPRIDVDEYGADAVPPQRMGRGDETVRRRNHFARDAQRLQGRNQRQRPVGEKTDMLHAQIGAERPLQLPMVVPVVGDPFTVPDVAQQGVEFLDRRQQGRSYRNRFRIVHM